MNPPKVGVVAQVVERAWLELSAAEVVPFSFLHSIFSSI